jgi:formate dehydrogenase beta subunit
MPSAVKVMTPLQGGVDVLDNLSDALRYCRATGLHDAPVVDGDQVVGFIGYSELLAAADQDLAAEPVSRHMRSTELRSGADSLESVAEAMLRYGVPGIAIYEEAGSFFKPRREQVGWVDALTVLREIGKTTTDTAPMKMFLGRKDLGFNIPVSPCQRACPIHQDIATYVDYVSQGRYVDSWLAIHETNPFPSMLGRLCNHPCETDCKRGWIEGPENSVSIKSLKRFATDKAWERRLKIQYKKAAPNGKRVAIVGSGCAGLTAAQDLALMGYDVTVFEREQKLGGLLTASIPHFRFDYDQVLWEIEMIMDLGVHTQLGVDVGTDVTVTQLLEQYDAAFVAVGMMKGRVLPIPGHDLPEVTTAMEFLRQRSFGWTPPGFKPGARVVVVGGGAVATDAAQTSIKTGAVEVHMCSIEPRDRLPAFGNELVEATEIGLKIDTGIIVNAIKGENGHVTGVEFMRVDADRLQFDPESSKLIIPSVQKVPGSEFVIPCDYVIFASGQIMEAPGTEVPLSPRKLVEADTAGKTSVDRLFAGGDCVEGPSFIVNAVAWGHRVAHAINERLGAAVPVDAVALTVLESTDDHRQADLYAREEPPILPPDERRNMTPVELPWSDREAITAALRCFQCDTVHHVDETTCILCGACDDVCPEKALDVVVYGEERETSSGGFVEICNTSLGEVEGGKAGKILVNYDRCTNCRICEDHCPVNCITFQRVRFRDDTMRLIPLTPVARPAGAVK